MSKNEINPKKVCYSELFQLNLRFFTLIIEKYLLSLKIFDLFEYMFFTNLKFYLLLFFLKKEI